MFSRSVLNRESITRRPLESRNTKWAKAIASLLVKIGATPNSISLAALFFAAISGFCLWGASRTVFNWHWIIMLTLAAAGMQLRLLCNLFDGMVAIEGGLKTPAGELFNELPDRFSDAFIFIGAAYSVPGLWGNLELGWTAAVLAIITAYVRALGGSMGARQHFIGPMAKQQRMALMTFACLIAACAARWQTLSYSIPVSLALVVIGCVVTIFRRCSLISRDLVQLK